MKRAVFMAIMLFAFMQIKAQPKEIIILHTNDLHSHFEGGAPVSAYSPLTTNDDKTIGGFARIATLIKQTKEGNPNVWVFDAGDFLMGSLYQALEMESGFQLNLMKKMGYDAVCIGNHEFDFGVNLFADYVVNAQKKGGIPYLLASNIECDPKDERDDRLQVLFDKEVIRTYQVIERNGIKIGVFGILGKDAYEVTNQESIIHKDVFKTAKKIVKYLREEEKVDVVVALSHSGIYFENGQITEREDVKLAQKVDGIDVIVSGHTHTKMEEPIQMNNTLIVQAQEYGKFLGKLSISIENGEVKLKDYELLPVNDKVKGNNEIHQAILQQRQALGQVLQKMNLKYDDLIFESDYALNYTKIENSNIGNFIVDAIHHNVKKNVAGGTDIAMLGHGLIRASIPAGKVYLPEVFDAVSLGEGSDGLPGYSLAKIYVTGSEIKKILELLFFQSKKSPGYHCYLSGLKVEYNPNKRLFKKIKRMSILQADGSYKEISMKKKDETLYSVAADWYMLSFVGKIKKMSFGIVDIEVKDQNGKPIEKIEDIICDFDKKKPGVQQSKIWVSIIEYAKTFRDNDKNAIPDLPKKYKAIEKRYIVVE